MDMRTIPFTCTYLPGRENAVFALAVYFVGFLLFAQVAAKFDYWLLVHRNFLLVFLLPVIAGLLAIRYLRETNQPIEYEQPSGDLQRLRLSE